MDGRIVIVENGELIAVYNVKTMMDFDPKNRIKAPLDVIPLPKESNQRMDIRCCIPIKIGLIFVFGDSCVYYYEKTNHRFITQLKTINTKNISCAKLAIRQVQKTK
jgi:hypothetical protein